ncbi:hypothetical protein QAD02_005450 [Eretmocerus hayati]|uniref:Uncharacterized protein n=1 Tax=Eretmocerus hayati TaxID=131215 RepID=A0ACC2NTJ3_9HYME|nr:hypothetical protein QAD02_005450 [Eretmocerus hayati]
MYPNGLNMSRSIIFGIVLGLFICSVSLASQDPNNEATHIRHPRFAGIPEPKVELAINGILKYRDEHICNVAFIAKNIMLTAAQCFSGRVSKYFTVKMGSSEISVSRVYYHQHFHSLTFLDDIAILSAKKPFPIAEEQILKISPELPKNYQNMTYFTYYDVQSDNDWDSFKSFDGLVKFVPNSECAKAYRSKESWLKGQLCVANATDRTGETIYTKKPGTPIVNGRDLIGIVSSSSVCGWHMPDIITFIPYVYSWIEQRLDIADYVDTPFYEKWPLSEEELNLYRSVRPDKADPKEAEFLVLIEYRDSPKKCVGVIISERVILTTGECADEADTNTVDIVLNPYKGISESQRLEVIDIQIHPKYSRTKVMDPYNVAVMQLAQPLPQNAYTIIKPATRKPLAQDKTIIYGYDEKNQVESLTPKVMSYGDECERLLLKEEIYSNGKICAKYRLGVGIKRQGSPLIVLEREGETYKKRLAGLLTPMIGVDLADYRNPAVFVNLAEGLAPKWVVARISEELQRLFIMGGSSLRNTNPVQTIDCENHRVRRMNSTLPTWNNYQLKLYEILENPGNLGVEVLVELLKDVLSNNPLVIVENI